MLIHALIFIIASLVLIKSSAYLVKSLVSIAKFLHWSEYIVSFVLIGIVTSLPELFIGIGAASRGASNLALGNAIGSNIVNLTLIAGLIVLFARHIKIKDKLIQRDIWIVFALACLPILFLVNKTLSRLEGLALIGFFIIYFIYLLKKQKKPLEVVDEFSEIKTILKTVLVFAISLIVLLASAWLIVYAVQEIAQGFNASLIFLGIILVALGTSLPELIFGLRATLMKHKKMHIGGLVGSTAANSALILGITALIRPIQLNGSTSFWIGAIFMLGAILLFNLFVRTRKKLSWWEGLLLILFYVIFVIVELVV